MVELFIARYVYLMIVVLLIIGLYGMLGKRNLLKKLIGMNIFQTAIFLFFIEGATKAGGSVPVIDQQLGMAAAQYVNPLPHVLILTGIVVGLALTGVALAFILVIYRAYNTLDDKAIMKEMSK
ncbi:MAG: cation:proton antiporter [Dehalococcoidales bacterium]|nr:cation:proton antiporter [Dehalococcoidales bacterium]MDP6576819.1 cation:proton antiporter subunit C [Dehalococcoidales bacterium]MDP6825475.1 cation:proton antiporter subunit C [Dehalococcoidales bacterium]|tara:strand:- start:670 stop:1038 length:369 start_codon:yes stop_codon:yes gene_type:complete